MTTDPTPTPDVEAVRAHRPVGITVDRVQCVCDRAAWLTVDDWAEHLAAALRAAPQGDDFDTLLSEQMRDPEFAAAYQAARERTPAPQQPVPDDGALTDEERAILREWHDSPSTSASNMLRRLETAVERILAARAAWRDPQPELRTSLDALTERGRR